MGLIGLVLVAGLLLAGSAAVTGLLVGRQDASAPPVELGVVLGVLIVIGLAAVFAQLNLIAKRTRDMGLPGWLCAAVFFVLTGGAHQGIAEAGGSGIGLILIILMLLVPTDAFRSGPRT